MIFSAEQLFSDDQAITATAASTNVIDLGATGTVLNAPNDLKRDLGKGTPIPILIQVTEDFATLTSLTVSVQTDDDENFGTATTVLSSPAVPVADLVEGYKFPIIWVPIGVNKRYLRLNYTVAGSNATTGKVTAGIVMGVQTNVVAGVEGLGGT